MPRPVQPARYVVDRQGTPDPESSAYYVLDVVNDWMAREALALFGNKLRQRGHEARSKEIFEYLDATLPAHAAVMEARNPKSKSKSSKKENLAP